MFCNISNIPTSRMIQVPDVMASCNAESPSRFGLFAPPEVKKTKTPRRHQTVGAWKLPTLFLDSILLTVQLTAVIAYMKLPAGPGFGPLRCFKGSEVCAEILCV